MLPSTRQIFDQESARDHEEMSSVERRIRHSCPAHPRENSLLPATEPLAASWHPRRICWRNSESMPARLSASDPLHFSEVMRRFVDAPVCPGQYGQASARSLNKMPTQGAEAAVN